jgi:hypothetical protein
MMAALCHDRVEDGRYSEARCTCWRIEGSNTPGHKGLTGVYSDFTLDAIRKAFGITLKRDRLCPEKTGDFCSLNRTW